MKSKGFAKTLKAPKLGLKDLLKSGQIMPASELAKAKAAKAKEQETFKQSVENEASLRKSRAPSGIVESKPVFTRTRVSEPVIRSIKSKKTSN